MPAATLLGKFYLVRPAEYNLEDRLEIDLIITANRAVNSIS